MSFIIERTPVPTHLQGFLTRFGGKNPFGRPQWRLQFSDNIFVREAGVYRDWPEGLTTAEKGGFNFEATDEQVMAEIGGKAFEELGEQPMWSALRYENKPLRVVTEVRDNPRYPGIHGWIVEKWFPASKYGSPQDWYSFLAIDGKTPMLGPYPNEGDYEMIYGPFPRQPSISQLQLWISNYSRTRDEMKSTGTPESRAIEYANRRVDEEQEQWQRRRKEYMYMMASEWKSIATNGALGMSRYRQELAERCGITEHIGLLEG
jgi:hypothetical protein